jgi:hypothetical protein
MHCNSTPNSHQPRLSNPSAMNAPDPTNAYAEMVANEQNHPLWGCALNQTLDDV